MSTVRDAALPTVDGEVGLADTIGILRQPWVRPFRSSAGRGWRGLYVSTQSEQPYQAIFEPADTPLAILHLGGPVVVEHGDSGGVERKTMPAGGFFLHPAGPERDVHLGGDLNTVHANLTVDQFEQAAQGSRVELAPTLRANDPMIEQLLMAMDGVLTNDVPTALTYVDHLTAMLAAHLTHRYNAVTATGYSPTSTVELTRALMTASARNIVRRRLSSRKGCSAAMRQSVGEHNERESEHGANRGRHRYLRRKFGETEWSTMSSMVNRREDGAAYPRLDEMRLTQPDR